MDGRIPITIGVTGHRDILDSQNRELLEIIKTDLLKLKNKYKDSEILMLNSLAEGADILCAQAAFELGIKICAVLPFCEEEYIKDFSSERQNSFKTALSACSSVVIMDGDISDRDTQYRKAGLYVAEHSHILYALWNGKEGTPTGCGTSDVVYHVIRTEKDYLIRHIKISRVKDNFVSDLESCYLGTKTIDGEFSILGALDKTNEYNRKAKQSGYNGAENILDSIYDNADRLSLFNQKKYNSGIKALAVIGFLMVFSFLIYDELYFKFFLPLYALLLLSGAIILYIDKKKNYHENYISYRLLAESIRAQKVVTDCGIECNSASYYPWTQSLYTLWIKKAIDAIAISNMPSIGTKCSTWLSEQRQYHERAYVRTLKKNKNNERISTIVTVLTIVTIIASIVVQIYTDMFDSYILFGYSLRTYMLVLVGTLSAITLFLSSYYGKMNLGRKMSDHINMIRLYEHGEKLMLNKGLNEDVIKEIVREEIIENGNWYSYTIENGLDLSL